MTVEGEEAVLPSVLELGDRGTPRAGEFGGVFEAFYEVSLAQHLADDLALDADAFAVDDADDLESLFVCLDKIRLNNVADVLW